MSTIVRECYKTATDLSNSPTALFLGGAMLISALAAGTIGFWTFMTIASIRLVVNLMTSQSSGDAFRVSGL